MAEPRKKNEGKKSNAGRKQFDGKPVEIVLQKLEEVWALGGSDKEAAFFAGISASALSAFLKANPDISERKETLLERPILLARRALIEGFDGHTYKVKEKKKVNGKEVEVEVERQALKNPNLALQFLERVRRNEFSTKSEVHHRDKTMEQLLEEANRHEGDGEAGGPNT